MKISNAPNRTIRRALEKGEMHKDLLEQIAKKINIDPSFLSGEIYHSCFRYDNEGLIDAALSKLTISDYPYFKKEQTGYQADEYIKHVLMFYDISFGIVSRSICIKLVFPVPFFPTIAAASNTFPP